MEEKIARSDVIRVLDELIEETEGRINEYAENGGENTDYLDGKVAALKEAKRKLPAA